MKKITLFLSVLLMALVVKAQDAEIETYDFKNWPESSVTLTVGDVIGKVNGADVSQCTYTGLERFAFQGVANGNGNGIWLRVGYGLYSYGAGRSMSILNLNAGDVVTIKSGSISFPDGAVGNGEWILQTIDGGYVVKMKTNGNIGIAIGKNVYIYSITIEPNGFDPNANVPVTGITLDKSTAEITEGMVLNLLAATLIPDDATDRSITWSSSNEDIATVNGGQVTGVAVGTAVITAEANGFTATCEVSVKEKVVKTSWDFATLQAGLPNKTGMTYAVNTVKVAGTDCSYGINEYEGLAVQEAGAWFLYSDGGLYNGTSGGRKIGVLNLKKGQIVTVVANTDTG